MDFNHGKNFLDIYNSESDVDGQHNNKGGTSSQNNNTTSASGNEGSSTDPDNDEMMHGELMGGGGWPTPLDIIDTVKGYEQTSFETTSVPPPLELVDPIAAAAIANAAAKVAGGSSEEDENGAKASKVDEEDGVTPKPPSPPPQPLNLDSGAVVTDKEFLRARLLEYIKKNHCCYGTGAARNMSIKKMEYIPAFHYELQTFSEKRETAWTYSPIRHGYGETVGLLGGGGVPPLPWEIEEQPTQPFKDEVRLIAVPNTISIKSCQRCRGTGGITCRDCNGKGWSRCLHCHGDGYMISASEGTHRERCFYCHHSKHGHGQQDCSKCQTKGKVNCTTCEGHGQIKCYIQLSITWKVHTAEHIVEKLNLPNAADLIRDVSGQVAFEEDQPKIKALRSVSDPGIAMASEQLVSKHTNAFSDQRVVRQRHQVRIVPVTQVTYEWKGKDHVFYVYGYENKVHLTKYPQNCCWGCVIC